MRTYLSTLPACHFFQRRSRYGWWKREWVYRVLLSPAAISNGAIRSGTLLEAAIAALSLIIVTVGLRPDELSRLRHLAEG